VRDETRKRLDRLHRRSGREIAVMFAAVILFFGIPLYFLRINQSEREVSGTVQWAAWQNDPNTGQRYPDVEVRLDDGSLVRLNTLIPGLPEKGARVTLREQTSNFGFRSYFWDGPKQ
jgi:hypothetical protein